jgi:hypothetical protein
MPSAVQDPVLKCGAIFRKCSRLESTGALGPALLARIDAFGFA